MNPACIKPVHGFQICILGWVTDADDGVGFDILGQAKEFCQGGLAGSAGTNAYPACAQALFHGLQEYIFGAGAQILGTQPGQALLNPERDILFQYHDGEGAVCSARPPGLSFCMAVSTSRSSTTMNSQGCPLMPLVARIAARRMLSTFSASTLLSAKLRMDFLFAIASIIIIPPMLCHSQTNGSIYC